MQCIKTEEAVPQNTIIDPPQIEVKMKCCLVFFYLILIFYCSGCANQFSKNYTLAHHQTEYSQEYKDTKIVIKSTKDIVPYTLKMKKSGYAILGWSKFSINKIANTNDALATARELKADMVVVFETHIWGKYHTSPTSFSGSSYQIGSTTFFNFYQDGWYSESLHDYVAVFYKKLAEHPKNDDLPEKVCDYVLRSNALGSGEDVRRITIPLPHNYVSLNSLYKKNIYELCGWIFSAPHQLFFDIGILDIYLEDTEDLHKAIDLLETKRINFYTTSKRTSSIRTISSPARVILIQHSKASYYSNSLPDEEFEAAMLAHKEEHPMYFKKYNDIAYKITYNPNLLWGYAPTYETLTCAYIYSPKTRSKLKITIGSANTENDLKWAQENMDTLVDFILNKSDKINVDINQVIISRRIE